MTLITNHHTDDYEFVEFQVGQNTFGISIDQVREIIQPVPVTSIPHAHPFIEGIIQLRGDVLPVIDMKRVIECGEEEQGESKYIVADFVHETVVFHVTAVSQIRRISSSSIEAASDLYMNERLPISGIVKKEDRMVMLVNFEQMIKEQLTVEK
ncbi:chemotaxis protein CheW [Sporosarcina sp. HYO08]|uniref:chemotaxis protein CheW n=1 Tax=Sporosarcina sp. HYO08 TaxID=1759557 RepID=UPI00079C496F|nr:chemotaxis protein CheW [Sporosarcina sp. HYO08]KXH79821.1 hypothetical protein AU377_10075 [Sporosarcina sp. HYO08]